MVDRQIILRKDFLRVRARIRARFRRGEIRAELEETRRIARVVDVLKGKVDLCGWDGSRPDDTDQIILAVIAEWEGMTAAGVVRRFYQVLVEGSLRFLQEQGELRVRRDSYGRQSYRMMRRRHA